MRGAGDGFFSERMYSTLKVYEYRVAARGKGSHADSPNKVERCGLGPLGATWGHLGLVPGTNPKQCCLLLQRHAKQSFWNLLPEKVSGGARPLFLTSDDHFVLKVMG